MFKIMSDDQSKIPVVCDNLAEAQNPSGIIEFFQNNKDFEDAEKIAIHALDKTQGVKLIQEVFVYPRTPEQEQAEREAAELIKQLAALLPKRRLLCTPTQVDLLGLIQDWNSELQDA
jgi:hypothetical protein